MYDISSGTIIKLLSVDFNSDMTHQPLFYSRSEQESYFSRRVRKTLMDYSYQRLPNGTGKFANVIRCNLPIDELQNYNYVMYSNTRFSNRYFYAFIEKLEYRAENTTYIHLKEDSFQNWQFDITFNPCFVERETPSKDYLNTLQDDVAKGQLVQSNFYTEKDLHGAYFIFCSSDVTQDDTSGSEVYNFSCGDYSLPCMILYFHDTQKDEMGQTMQKIANKGRGDRIISANFMPFIPDQVQMTTYDTTTDIGNIRILTSLNPATMFDDFELNLWDYTIGKFYKNATYPYCVVKLEDMASGQTLELSPEKFNNGKIRFRVFASISDNPYYRIVPMGYEGQYLSYCNSMVVRCNTSLPVINNMYAKYMMMNSEQNRNSIIANLGSMGLSALTMNPLAVAGSGFNLFNSVANITARENQASKLGNTVTTIQDGAMERIVYNCNKLKVSLWVTDKDHQAMNNSFWGAFGYPVRQYKIPNINGNGDYSFIKLTEVNITGDNVPNEEILNIEEMFKHGVTLWRNYNNMYKYREY